MTSIVSAEHAQSLSPTIPCKDFLYEQERQQLASLAAKRNLFADLDFLRGRDRECDRNWKQGAVREPHLFEHALVIGLVHKAVERRECARRQQLQIAERARRELEREETVPSSQQLVALLCLSGQINQGSAQRRNEQCVPACRFLHPFGQKLMPVCIGLTSTALIF